MPVNVTISADAFTGDVFHEDRYFFGVKPPYSPVLMAAGFQTGLAYGSPVYGPFQLTSGALYCLLAANSGAFIGVFRSLDSGATWLEQDGGNHPTNGNNSVSCCVRNGNTLVVAYLSAAAPAQIRFRNFDLTANTWGAEYGSGAGVPTNAGNFSGVYVRPDGTLATIYQKTPNPAPPASNMGFAVYSQASPGGAWVTTIDAGTNLVADPGWGVGDLILVSKTCSVMDPAGLIHSFPCDSQNGVCAYQQIKADNTLGPYQNFKAPVGPDNLQVFSGLPIGHPLVVGSNLVVPISAKLGPWPSGNPGLQTATIYVGAPLSNPVFTLLGIPGIDPDDTNYLVNGENTDTPSNVPFLFSDGVTIFAVWPRLDSSATGNQFSQLRLGQTNNLTNPLLGWTDSTIFDLALNSPPGFDFAGQEVQLPSVFSLVTPSTRPASFSGGAGPYVIPRPCCRDPHELALEAEARERTKQRRWPYPWSYSPDGAIRVTSIPTTIATPAPGTPTQGLLYTVDEGFQFALTHLVVLYIGGTPDPGAFNWSLTLNQPVGVTSFQGVGVQGFTAVDVSLGTIQIPWPLDCAELFQPNDAIRVVFTNNTLGGGFFKSILLGWKWPAIMPGR
jgi:hypothetical protein